MSIPFFLLGARMARPHEREARTGNATVWGVSFIK